ncbi:YihY family inner membrane protein [Helicobacter cappadocius]|uniref:YihY family inner membrane protein n=1 Tax=Helicobacter cappadocius TaxID=3063998 RepID=A0AA90T4Y3_9HELI|nr:MULTISPECIES: YihY family inner membrane protein [unclassified Helicobacter]MDO7252810.1 YihY family inner membrane protein [Helicobacter sp. faydin-H75]MDP2538853.1 YihY family inner membrane protein [Helicobacter sp. faydin-H76]
MKFAVIRNFSIVFKDKIKEVVNFLTHEQAMFYYASSLSFYTVFAMIPLLLILFSIVLKFPNFQNKFNEFKALILSNILPDYTGVIVSFFDTFVQNSSKIGTIGFVYVLFTSLMFFRNYEFITSKVFNSKPRRFFESLIVYLVMMAVFPAGISILIYFSAEVQGVFKNKQNISIFANVLAWLATCLLFLILFKISANKRLNKKLLLLTSCLSASLWYFLKWAFVYYVSYNKTYPTLYGSVSVLLILMLWVYISWLVLLFGMRIYEALISDFGKKRESLSFKYKV